MLSPHIVLAAVAVLLSACSEGGSFKEAAGPSDKSGQVVPFRRAQMSDGGPLAYESSFYCAQATVDRLAQGLSAHRIESGEQSVLALRRYLDVATEGIDDEQFQKVTLCFDSLQRRSDWYSIESGGCSALVSVGSCAWPDSYVHSRAIAERLSVRYVDGSFELKGVLRTESGQAVQLDLMASERPLDQLSAWEGGGGGLGAQEYPPQHWRDDARRFAPASVDEWRQSVVDLR